jgi:hypothetical protein
MKSQTEGAPIARLQNSPSETEHKVANLDPVSYFQEASASQT